MANALPVLGVSRARGGPAKVWWNGGRVGKGIGDISLRWWLQRLFQQFEPRTLDDLTEFDGDCF